MKKFAVFMALLVCVLSFAACGQETDKNSDTDVNYMALTEEERKDIFASYFNNTPYDTDEIKKNLDKIDTLAVLTLDEALTVFWQENGLNPKDYLQKTDENGHVYYQHKVENNEISVFVNLLYDLTENENSVTDSGTEYGFYVVQTNGRDYFISINGDMRTVE